MVCLVSAVCSSSIGPLCQRQGALHLRPAPRPAHAIPSRHSPPSSPNYTAANRNQRSRAWSEFSLVTASLRTPRCMPGCSAKIELETLCWPGALSALSRYRLDMPGTVGTLLHGIPTKDGRHESASLDRSWKIPKASRSSLALVLPSCSMGNASGPIRLYSHAMTQLVFIVAIPFIFSSSPVS